MAWFRRKEKNISDLEKKDIPSGLWIKCPSCTEIQYKPELDKNHSVCRHCGHHFRVLPTVYRDILLDQESREELFSNVKSADPLNFKAQKKYTDQLKVAMSKTNQNDAINCYSGSINGKGLILSVMNFGFIGGSMGSVVGELISRSADLAREKKIPFVLVCASGGARMQESALALMQLAKTSSKLARFQEEGGLYIPILTDPTTGGVTASFGMLGDIILAEPGALIGFAGPRVIKQTIGEDLPEGFQRAEFLQDKGFVDHIVPRENMKEILSKIIELLSA
ncbi:MAG: acetyl-CoA carboxylase carboxyltransferase subunit beta [Candidatus Marinimicrobia bacterium]|jgi:acetyl-CoA carboxylase carboxyl transferase subunit beta|uniref:Acetyl-coenzyme A carboxylase carboxyl transferase subunit beta n=1 Tax=uncultured bacterium FPPZ_5C6 TaxID=1343849 RepID=S4W7Q2_9BACT|nr:carboxylase carboxyl transferase subunit beta [uncultured bacterium FPPZ_5C6]MBT3478732.1 acetyl-CoA carboxylase carboxyltransferase subunit beta [Candidatus Neomarinimicrobiota bacterium]MBT3676389.1 acetyl-CoA carboxylase carboxyltransferase subunit beta [Candidatus Neomarinimicrobiota bacterium]MBT3763244.1 acetyl-CoA carboxylase carboxyltransferase subunit beta [Candidatus Neomarinimicrobiota bacterium]MBT4069030.1 acetyl-CoA carboxylase carboxyltransferase subunit beta [Candidatus Neoma